MMLIDASCPSNRLAAVTIRTGIASTGQARSRMCTAQEEPSPTTWVEAAAGTFHLAGARLSAEMGGDLEDVGQAGRAERVALRQEATRRVDRDAAVALGRAGAEELGRAARRAEGEVLVVEQLGGGEAVVQLDDVEVCRPDSRALVGPLGRECRERVEVG